MKTQNNGSAEPNILGEGITPTQESNETIKSSSRLDPFDPANLRVDRSYLQRGAAKKLLTKIPVRKPHNQEFVRVHPREEYRLSPAAFVDLKDDRETYLVSPEVVPELNENEYVYSTLYLTINRQKTLSFWSVRLPGPDGKRNEWHVSAEDAAERAMKGWIRMASNLNLKGYDIYEALGNLNEPEWPDLPLKELLHIAFKGFFIDTGEHPVIQKLRGLI